MNKQLNLVLAVALTIVALATGQTAWAESTWTVTNNNGNSNTFTIKRSETGYVQKVLYRTISLSAYAGQHFTAKYGELEFKEDEDTKTVTVNELSPTGAYLYYTNGTTVKYGFEVTDRAGFRLDYAERSKTWGTSVPASGIFDEKELNIHSNPITVTDGGYAQAYHSVNVGNYYTAAPKSYLTAVGAQLRMTVTFDAREKDDGYQYIQIYANTTADADHTDTGAKDGNPGTINYSKYMAGFTIDGNVSSTYFPYTFPLTSKGSNCGYVAHPWSGNSNGNLEQQYFNTNCRATDGRLIIPTELTSLYVRFNASGNNNDTWYAQNVKAHIQAVDGTNPTKSAVSVNPGRHAKGNTVYVSVAFSEIVTSTNATLSTSWGPMTLEAGSGTNVLTFSTTIPQDATGNLNITGISGTIKDLAGKSLSGGVTASNLCSLDADFAYAINDFQQEDGNYLIKTHEDLIGLAGFVNSGNKCKNLTFLQVADIAFPHATNWNSSSSTENNYIAIGTYDNPFCGTFSGQAHTISGIRIYKSNTSNLGLFGAVMENGTVKRVNLVDARITAGHCAAGIVGRTYIATIEDCTVGDDVCIHTAQSEIQSHGGIVGANQGAPVRRCISRATLTVADGLNGCYCYGGIVGKNWSNTITDCIAEGVVIPDVNGRGAIVGYKENVGTLTRNYYRGCTVAGVANATGVGRGNGESSKTTSDVDGARALYAITLGTNVTIDHTPATDPLPGTNNMTYDNGADINGLAYAYAGATVTLNYTGEVGTGYHVEYSTTAGTLEGNTLTMPSEDVTVSAVISVLYIDADGNVQYCTDFTVIKSSNHNVSYSGGWYLVTDDVTIKGNNYNHALQFEGDTHLILCDGASLTASLALQRVQGRSYMVKVSGNLTIYGQSEGTGTLTTSNTIGGRVVGNLNTQISGIYSHGNMTINGGIVQASASDNSSENNYTCGIKTNGNFTFNGGHVSATASNSYRIYGLYADGSITLGWRSPSDRFYAKTYNKDVTIRDGQAFSNGQSVYSGTVNKNDLRAKTLQPSVALAMNSAGICTYASPYALDLSNVNAYVVSDYNSGNSTLTLTKATEAPANTGLLLKAKDDGQKNTTIALPLQESAEAVGENLLVGVTDGATIVHQTEGSYTNFILANGKYGIDWYTLSEAGAIGANKAYLQLPTAEVSNGRAFTWVYDEGTATKIERPTPDPSLYGGKWYTLNGVKLSGKPTTKGLYIHNGRKEVVR